MAQALKSHKGVRLAPLNRVAGKMLKDLNSVDTQALEAASGLIIKSGKFAADAMNWDNWMLVCFLAQRQRLQDAQQPVTMETLLGKHAPGTALRQMFTADIADTMRREYDKRTLVIRVEQDSSTLKLFEAFVAEAVEIIIASDTLVQDPNRPKPHYTVIPGGAALGAPSGTHPTLKAALKVKLEALAAKEAEQAE